ncbi:MAG: VWA domain-containing protein [Acidobacteriota bacterium]|nr:VWA domain-containing protein [Acidobacteriota bacterium]
MKRLYFAITGFALAAALIPLARPQQAAQIGQPIDENAPIKVNVDVVNILCAVRDKHGALINNLSKDDFQLAEDGKPQTIKYFTRETDLPLTIGLLVDVSGSQERLIEIERQAAYNFFSSVLKKKDVAFLISFGADAELLQDITGSPKLLREGLDRLKLNAGFSGIHPGPVPTISQPRGTVLYDAIYLAASDRLSKEVGRKAIVLITDGVDQGSRLKLEAAVEAAQKADAVVYSIYYVDPGAYGGMGFGFGGGGEGYLKKMSEETGGHVFRVDRKHSLDNIFEELQQEMRSQYSIGFTPTNDRKDGSYRKLDLHTQDRNLKVQARKGYYAIRPEDR